MSDLQFRASSKCNNGSCLIIARDGEHAVVGDSKTPGVTLRFSTNDFDRFLARLKYGAWPSLAERFWSKVDACGDCWEWSAGLDAGYGLFQVGGEQFRAHRWAWEHLVGPIPAGYQLDHLCRNRACVNPDHLEPVTQQENLARGYGIYAINSRKTRCKNGHPYTPENTYWRPDGKGRMCAVCQRHRGRSRKEAS